MVQTTAKGYPYPETSDSPHGPDQLQNLADRADELTDAARMTETERDALAAPDLYDGRAVKIVDSGGVWQRIEIYHADDPADPDLGGTWRVLLDRTLADGVYATAVEHSSDATVVRPAGALVVMWLGTVAPDNAAAGDMWYDRSAELWKRWDGAAWQASGSATYAPITARAARVYLGSDQSISNSTWAKVQIDSTTHDPHGLFDSANNVLSLDRAGMWLVTVGATHAASTDGSMRLCAIAHNGTRVVQANVPPTGTDWAHPNVADVIEVASGDTVEVQALQNSGGSLAVKGIEHGTWVSAAYLGSA